MFFKRLFAFWFLVGILLGCAGENKPPAPAIQVHLKGDVGCLDRLGPKIKDYFSARLSDDETKSIFNCLSHAVFEFQRLTTGTLENGAYTPESVFRFLKTHFFKELQLSPELSSDLMALKKILLSGAIDRIEKEKLTELRVLLDQLKGIALDLRPHIPILLGARVGTDQEREIAVQKLGRNLVLIGAWLQRQGEPLPFHQIQRALANLKTLFDGSSGGLISDLERKISLLPYLKLIALAGQSDRIESDKWMAFFEAVGHGLGAFLHFRVFFQEDLNSALVRRAVPQSVLSLVRLFNLSNSHHPNGVPIELWDRLFMELESVELVGEGKAAAFQSTLRWMLSRGFSEDRNEVRSLTPEHVERMQDVALTWLALLNPGEGPMGKDEGAFARVLSASAPMAWDAQGRLEHRRPGPADWSISARRRMVWPFVILNWLRRAYVGDRDHLTPSDMDVAVAEVLPILQSFGWLKDTKLTIGRRLLREADLFTSASNGDLLLDLNEAVRYLVFVASGFRSAEIWMTEAARHCGPEPQVNCVRRIATRADSDILSSMPHLRSVVLSRPEFFITYMKQGEEIVFGKVAPQLSTLDILQVWQIFQYVEMFLRLYDVSENELISLDEALAAYPIYGPTLNSLFSPPGHPLPEQDLLAFFTFMMKYGDTPEMFGGQVLFNHWKWRPNEWSLSADRSILMGILNQLSKR